MNPKKKSLIVGACIGAALGALAGYLFTRGLELPREGEEQRAVAPRTVPPGELVKLSIAIMGVLRGIAELGQRV